MKRPALAFVAALLLAGCGSTAPIDPDEGAAPGTTSGSTGSVIVAGDTGSTSTGGHTDLGATNGSTGSAGAATTGAATTGSTPSGSRRCSWQDAHVSSCAVSCGTDAVQCYPSDQFCCCQGDSDCWTPLVFVFDRAPVVFGAARGHFELVRAGSGLTTDWPSARTPWLALDVNENGTIDDGRELFGSMTVLPSGGVARQGFEALAALDSDGDGVIDARDAAFSRLRVWSDTDQDRRSRPAELSSLAARGIVQISLRCATQRRCDDRGNCEVERAPFLWRDGTGALRSGEVVDVHLAARPAR